MPKRSKKTGNNNNNNKSKNSDSDEKEKPTSSSSKSKNENATTTTEVAKMDNDNNNNQIKDTQKDEQKNQQPVVQSKFSRLFLKVYFWLHVKWLIFMVRVYNYLHDVPPGEDQLQQATASSSSKIKEKKFIAIGDDHGLGVGDWVTFSGDSGINHYIDIQQPLLLSKWTKLNECKFASTSEDWVPSSATANYFEDCFHPDTGRHRNANIVMITVGSNDIGSPTATGENLKAIVTTLRTRMPSCLIIINIPPVPYLVRERPDDSKVKIRVLEKTQVLREAVKKLIMLNDEMNNGSIDNSNSVKKNNTTAGSSSLNQIEAKGVIRAGADLDEWFRQQPDAFCLGSLFLKPRAYKEIVKRRLGEIVHLTQITSEKSDLKKLLK